MVREFTFKHERPFDLKKKKKKEDDSDSISGC